MLKKIVITILASVILTSCGASNKSKIDKKCGDCAFDKPNNRQGTVHNSSSNIKRADRLLYDVGFNVYFDFDSYALSDNGKNKIKEFAQQYISQKSSKTILVNAHTDSFGTDKYNLFTLSPKRANAVKQELIKNGISPNNIKHFSYGSAKLFKDKKGFINYPKSRRVEVYIDHKKMVYK